MSSSTGSWKAKETLHKWITLLMLFTPASAAHAQESPIVPDRPGFSTGPYTVEPGQFNIELGYQYAFNHSGADRSTQTVPQLVFRAGVASGLEIDLLWDGWNLGDGDGQSSTTSVSDLTIGGKYRLSRHEQYNLTALGLLSLPAGNEPSTSDQVDPTLGLLWDYSGSRRISFFGVLLVTSTQVQGEREFSGQFAAGASRSLTDRVGVFIEYFNDIPFASEIDDQHAIDGGLTFLLNDDLQLDINAGTGLNNATDNFVGIGIAMRY